MDRPNFLILGVGKSGTTTLHHYLGLHPDVLVSTPKEPIFFEAEYERGMEYYWRTYFAEWSGQRAVGEARPGNLVLPYVAPRIRESLPDARLIVILRDPADRAFAAWWMRYSRGFESLGFEDALEANLDRIRRGLNWEGAEGERRWRAGLEPGPGPYLRSTPTYLESGYYDQHLARFQALFPEEQMRVLLMEDLKRDAEGVIRSLWAFLGVDPEVPLDSVRPRQPHLPPAAVPVYRIARMLRIDHRVPEPIRFAVISLLGRLRPRPRMSEETRRWLRAHFAPEVERLERRIGRDLSHWKG